MLDRRSCCICLISILVLLIPMAAQAARSERAGHAGDPCESMRHLNLGADSIGLPTTGAEITSARTGSDAGMAFCRVLGRIHPIDPNAGDIRFELNLPERWNGKALHYGGGTFDGYLRESNGLRHTEVGLRSQPTPLARGYATFGSDSGHHRSYFPLPDGINALNPKFARNPEMQRNFAGDALKKTHDVAVSLIARHYGRAPSRMYFIGGSTGGREALRAAESFPADYDGVVAAYPAWNLIELDLQFIRTAQALYAPGGYLGRSQTRLIEHTVEQNCDARDGLRDGIISNPSGCRVDPAELRCRDGRPHHGCLSDPQLHTLETFATPQKTVMPVANGVDSISGYNVLAGADLKYAVGLLHFPMRNPVLILNSFGYVIGDDVTRNFIPAGRHFNALTLDTNTVGPWRDEVIHEAQVLDASDVDLRPFLAHGGKLILVHGTTDTVIPTDSSVDYYRRLQSTLGATATASFAQLFLIPGLGHGFGKFDAGLDTIGMIDDWADRGLVPSGLTVTDNHNGRTRPLCAWPTWPRYNGSGNVNSASSFTCVNSVDTLSATSRQP